MSRSFLRLLAALFLATGLSPAGIAQQATTVSGVVQVIGLEKLKHGTHGKLAVEHNTLHFAAGTQETDVPISSIEDVLTGKDSQRLVGGTVGTLTMLAPYGSGRFLSLFRRKTDILTVEYRDASGGLHGVIFTLPPGQAAAVKKELVARGAHTTILLEEESPQSKSDTQKDEEKKP
jgi:hypothetical protein